MRVDRAELLRESVRKAVEIQERVRQEAQRLRDEKERRLEEEARERARRGR
jgi:vacuolar-type H+-ATPase subunit E/Vma4